MFPTLEHSNKIWTAIAVSVVYGIIKYHWPLDELTTRRPDICKQARVKYNIVFPNGIAEGTARRNCRCKDCKIAWSS